MRLPIRRIHWQSIEEKTQEKITDFFSTRKKSKDRVHLPTN